jgi:uncharacterized RmlC-like cupin family protein
MNTNKKVQLTSPSQGQSVQGVQSQHLVQGITNEMCGCEHISAGVVVMPPSKVARPHIHKDNELIIFFMEGWGACLVGEDLEVTFHGPGDFLYVPEGVIHMGVNLSTEHRITGVEMRTDPYFNEDVIIMTELEEKANEIAADLRAKFAAGELDLPADWKERGYGPYSFVDAETK